MSSPWLKTGAILIAIIGTELFSGLYDDILYPLAIKTLGPLYGGGGMSVFALIINWLFVMWYRRTEYDWYGFEETRLLEAEEALKEGLAKKTSKSRKLTFIILSIGDPFLGFAYYEGRKQGMKMSKRDWGIFFLANAIGIGFWLGILLGVSGLASLILGGRTIMGHVLDAEVVTGWVMNLFLAIGVLRVIQIVYKSHRRRKGKDGL
jgi:hypothetical protein